MGWKERMGSVLASLESPSKEQLKQALTEMKTSIEDVQSELESPGNKPYSRKLLFKNKEVELIVMNWSDLACAPHDHGSSYGWIEVLKGKTKHTVYDVENGHIPEALFEEQKEEGDTLFAPKKAVHKMKDAEGSGLVTLHLYAPPIKDMMVYDLEACAACVVSEECGAWWPKDLRQKVKEIRLKEL